jgi:hypothetical protein
MAIETTTHSFRCAASIGRNRRITAAAMAKAPRIVPITDAL